MPLVSLYECSSFEGLYLHMDFSATVSGLEARPGCWSHGSAVRVQAVGGASKAHSLYPCFIFRWTAESHYQQQWQGFEDFSLITLVVLWVAVKSLYCQGELAAVLGWERRAGAWVVFSGCVGFPAGAHGLSPICGYKADSCPGRKLSVHNSGSPGMEGFGIFPSFFLGVCGTSL